MLKIVHINPARTWRGGEQQTLYLVSYLKQANIRQFVFGKKHSELEKRCKELGVPYVSLPFLGELDFYTASSLARFIEENQITILHAHTGKAHGTGILTKWLLQRKNYPLKLVVSRRVDFSFKKTSLFPLLSSWKYRTEIVDHYIAISENVKRVLRADGIPEEKISVIYSGIDLSRYPAVTEKEKLKKELSLAEGEIIIGNVAALVDHKDHRTLIDALAILKTKIGDSWKVLILGEGELRKEIENRIQGYRLQDRVLLLGFRKDVFSFYSLFDIFVMSSKEEGLGTSILDAMVYGLPVVATDGGGIPEIVIHGKGGLLSPVRDSEKLAGNLAYLIRKPVLRKRMGKFNQKYVQKFDYRTTGRKTLELYTQLL